MSDKTNAMRILDRMHISYKSYDYSDTNAISGVEVASVLNQLPEQVFKTLVTVAQSNEHYVFMIPVAEELDLKKAARAVHEKNIEMVKSKTLLGLTGYIHGGCSPIGMKKYFKTCIHSSAENFDTIIFSAGKIGLQIELSLQNLKKVIDYQLADIIVESSTR
ncbi:MAG: Cys-tRNA(Pro) deacylase [Alphaproteobacteria bacterium]|nr:Cys-tRNA(Pro) deacylase [Alphaproteobacteria bacterium]